MKKACWRTSSFWIMGLVIWSSFIIPFSVSLYKQHTIYFFEFRTDLNATTMSKVRMHYSLDGDNLNKSSSARSKLNIHDEKDAYRFRLPMAKHSFIKFSSPTPFNIKDFRDYKIIKPNESLHTRLDSNDLNFSLESKFSFDGTRSNQNKANQYSLILKIPKGLYFPFLDFKQFIIRLLLTLISTAGVLFFALNFLLKLVYPKKDELKIFEPSAIYLGCFCLVLGVKLCIISYAGSIVPFGDQWNGEGNLLFIPYLQGRLEISDLFAPHNEHRILLSRLSSLFLFELNGRVWDPLLSMIFNATFHSSTIVFFIYALTKVFGSRYCISIALAFGLVALIPSGWENVLWGFQGCFYFYLLSGFMMLCFAFSKTLSLSRVLFTACFSILSYLSIAAGITITISIIIVLLIGLIRGPRSKNEITLIALLIPLVAFYWVMTPNVKGHEVLIAHEVGDFLHVFLKNMSWPFTWCSWPALILNLPMILLCIRSFMRKEEREPKFQMLLGIFIWLILYASSIAYMRSAHISVASRYTDLSSLIVVVNFLAIVMLIQSSPIRKHKNLAMAFTTLWFLLIIIGFSLLLENSISKIEEKKICGFKHTENLKEYFSTGDSEIITDRKKFDRALPFSRPNLLLKWLDDPAIRNIIPIELYDQGKHGSMTWLREALLSNGLTIIYLGIFFLIIFPAISFFKRIE